METYAGHRRIIDADSHVIELDDYLANAAREADLPLLPAMNEQTELPVVQAGMDRAREHFERRTRDPEHMRKFEAGLLDNTKNGWSRLGAFDGPERSHALNLFGFELQWVLPTFSFHQIAHVTDVDVLEAGARTLNKAMADFCAADERLLAIGYIPLSLGPEKAEALIRQGIQDGCYTFMVDTNEPDPKKPSFTHPDFDRVWALFPEHNRPFGCHVAANGHYKAVSPSFRNNGKTSIELGGDAPAGELGLMTIGNSMQIFFGAMIFDGVFERHPGLRGLSMEHAGVWLPSWLHALDFTARTFRHRRKFSESPGDTARSRIKVSPFAGEPVGWITEQVGPEMLVFASDYPHPEGTADPIRKFEATMTECDDATMARFYHGNMEELMDIRLPV